MCKSVIVCHGGRKVRQPNKLFILFVTSQEWNKVCSECQDLLNKVENISLCLFPLIANLKSRNTGDILAHLEDKMEGLGKDKFFLEKLNMAQNKVNYFLSGRSCEQVKAAENISVALKEKQSSLQVIKKI